ncbi:hypothetical protein LU293_07315 [Moraxella nasovis]|uniref:hypothetical protein n=1 Tax=Moraxella nasovis TaxID=2904121 RepID=UPI001F619D8B|nr:hypothetical protein [Moraxella nasovis]UNU72896.1 hypothetical protein LU293_07315 [Moraxella nasovis]
MIKTPIKDSYTKSGNITGKGVGVLSTHALPFWRFRFRASARLINGYCPRLVFCCLLR